MSEFLHAARFRRDHRWVPGRMSAFVDGELAARARVRLERHCAVCPECHGVLHSLSRMIETLQRSGGIDGATRGPAMSAAVLARLNDPPDRHAP